MADLSGLWPRAPETVEQTSVFRDQRVRFWRVKVEKISNTTAVCSTFFMGTST